MALSFAPASRARPRLLRAILCGIFLAGCSGGTSDPSSPRPPGTGTGTDPSPPDPPPGGSGPATDTLIGLSWLPNTDSTTGYLVYHGPTSDTVTTLAADVSVAALNGEPPGVSFNAGRDLSLSYGDSVCFRVRAYDADDGLSDWSDAACADI